MQGVKGFEKILLMKVSNLTIAPYSEWERSSR